MAALAGCAGEDGESAGSVLGHVGGAAVAPAERFERGREIRSSLGDQLPDGAVEHATNGDGSRYDEPIAVYGKGLPHDDRGVPDPDAYEQLRAALSGDADFESVPLAGERSLVTPQAALDHETQGADPHQMATPPAPRFDGPEAAGEMVELYWRALARDIPFREYEDSPVVDRAREELASIDAFADVAPTASTRVLFRGDHPGARQGPHVSQFLWRTIPRGAQRQDQRFRPYAERDYVTDYDQWLAIQRGAVPDAETERQSEPRYILTGRDLATYVHTNVPYQMFLGAALIMLEDGVAYDPGNPLADSEAQSAFLDLGAMSVTGDVTGVLHCVQRFNWYSKWVVHRRLRPETFGGRVHLDRAGEASFPFHDAVRDSVAVDRVEQEYGTALLPQAYPEGSPTHPAYPAGHAGIAGACAGVLKALFDMDDTLERTVRPTPDGQSLEPLDQELNVEDELTKLQFNNALGRDFAGIHYRSDGREGIRLGERVAAAYLNARVASMAVDGVSLTLPTVDGEELTVDGDLSRTYTF